MQFLTYIGYIIKYLLVGLGIAALFIVFMPGRFSINSPAQRTTDTENQVAQQAAPFSGYADMLDKARPAVVSIQLVLSYTL